MGKKEDKIRKEGLRQAAVDYKEKLEMDIDQSLEQLEKIAKASLVIGGSLIIGYSLYSLFASPKPKNKGSEGEEPKDDLLRPILKAGSELVASYLLGLAKAKLHNYIEDLQQVNQPENGNTQGPDSQEEGGN